MKIGIICDGSAESQALAKIVDAIHIYDVKFIRPIYADMQPKSTTALIAKKAERAIGILRSKKVDKIIVLIDFEDREGCPIAFSRKLSSAFHDKGMHETMIVIKVSKFENWLVADHKGLNTLKRFNVSKSFVNAVSPDKADNVDAVALLNSIIGGKTNIIKDETRLLLQKK